MTEKVTLQPMTRALCHEFYRDFENDPDIFMDMSLFKPYRYDPEQVDRYFAARQGADRVLRAVNADAVLKNRRSQHILEKVGFRYIGEDETFKYYRFERETAR